MIVCCIRTYDPCMFDFCLDIETLGNYYYSICAYKTYALPIELIAQSLIDSNIYTGGPTVRRLPSVHNYSSAIVRILQSSLCISYLNIVKLDEKV